MSSSNDVTRPSSRSSIRDRCCCSSASSIWWTTWSYPCYNNNNNIINNINKSPPAAAAAAARPPRRMAPSIGVNLRVSGSCSQGGRKYMEDAFAVAYQQTRDDADLEYAYFGVFDGHGGREAAIFAKEHLMDFIVSQKNFWSDHDDHVLKAIRDGFLATHMAMWKEVAKWPQTMSGLPSTSGSTASVVFIRKGKLYIGHVGDSAVALGYKEKNDERFSVRQLTNDHKPESPSERRRIENTGGSVMCKSGVQRVVWNRPRLGHRGPIRRSTRMDQIPFLAVARSLGDLWSYNYFHGEFIVSPEPDVSVVTLNPETDRCIILGSDGLWNMLNPSEAVAIVEEADKEIERRILEDMNTGNERRTWVNPSKMLIDRAISQWQKRKMLADNTSAVTVMLDPPGPPRSEVLKRQHVLNRLRPREEPDQVKDRRESKILVTSMPTNVEMGSAVKSEAKMNFPGEVRTKSQLNFKNVSGGGDAGRPTHIRIFHEPHPEPTDAYGLNYGDHRLQFPQMSALEKCKHCGKRKASCQCLNNCSNRGDESCSRAKDGALRTSKPEAFTSSCDTTPSADNSKAKLAPSDNNHQPRGRTLRPYSPNSSTKDASSSRRSRDKTPPPLRDDRPRSTSLSSRAAHYARRKFLAIKLKSPRKLLSRHPALRDKPQLVRQNASRLIDPASLSRIPGFLRSSRSPVVGLLTRMSGQQSLLRKLKPNRNGEWEIENRACSDDKTGKTRSQCSLKMKRKSTSSFMGEPRRKKLRPRSHSWTGGCVNEKRLRHCTKRNHVK